MHLYNPNVHPLVYREQAKVKGIYAAGDVLQKDLRQVVTATNDGAIAAQHIFHEITGM